jgi:hypothetical protein
VRFIAYELEISSSKRIYILLIWIYLQNLK